MNFTRRKVAVIHSPAYSIRTGRLWIRCYQPSDATLLKEAIDASLDQLRPWLPWAEREPEELEAKIERLRRFRGEFDLGQNFTYGAFAPDGSRLLGGTGLHPRIGEGGLEIGYWLRTGETGKGYMTETVSALIKVAFTIHKVERVEIHCDAANDRSAAVPRRLGFRREASLRRNGRDGKGDRKEELIWVLFNDEYENSSLAEFPVDAYDVLGRKIL